MKAIILAAGQGTRLRPLTNDRPKCMVEFNDKPIINHIIETMYHVGVSNIHIVTGYKSEVLREYFAKEGEKKVMLHFNEEYDSTNMLYSLWCASDEFNDDIIISYSDIIYSNDILQKLVDCQSKIAVTIDKDWRKLWELRMDDPLSDAESLLLDENENVIEIGKKTDSYDKIQGQYMGLIKISKDAWKEIVEVYDTIPDPRSMYMTNFLQLIVNKGIAVKTVSVYGGWLEIDSEKDLECYEKFF